MIKSFLIALQFLTRIPVQMNFQQSEQDIGYSLLYYPLIGFIIGTFLVALGWLLSGVPPFVAAALLIVAWVILTGGLHLDGLADSADAWIGGMGNRVKTLIIMKDPNCGPAGVVAILLLILLKFVALHSLFIANEWFALVLAITFARTCLLLLFLTTPYVRSQGLGSTLVKYQPRCQSVYVIAATVVLILIVAETDGLWLLLTAAFTFLLLRAYMLRRIGGTTGDTAGALVELVEAMVLLVAVVIKV